MNKFQKAMYSIGLVVTINSVSLLAFYLAYSLYGMAG